MKKIIYKSKQFGLYAGLVFLVLLCFGPSNLRAEESVFPEDNTYWSDPMMVKSENYKGKIGASSIMYFDHASTDHEGAFSTGYSADGYPNIFAFPGAIDEISSPLSNIFDAVLKDAPLYRFLEKGFIPNDNSETKGISNWAPVLADINENEVMWPYKLAPYEDDEGIKTYPSLIGIDPLTYLYSYKGDMLRQVVQQLYGFGEGSEELKSLNDDDPVNYGLVGFNSAQFGDELIVPIYNTIAMVHNNTQVPLTKKIILPQVEKKENMLNLLIETLNTNLPDDKKIGKVEFEGIVSSFLEKLNYLYLSPLAVFRNDSAGQLKLNGYVDSLNMSVFQALNFITDDKTGDIDVSRLINNFSNLSNMPLINDAYRLLECNFMLKGQQSVGAALLSIMNGEDMPDPSHSSSYYSDFANYNGKDFHQSCAVSQLRFMSYLHSQPIDVVPFGNHLVVINQMPILNVDNVIQFGRPLLFSYNKEAERFPNQRGYIHQSWRDALGLLEAEPSIWSTAVIYECVNPRTGSFNDDCRLKGSVFIPANSYNATAVVDGVLVATPDGIYHFNPEAEFKSAELNLVTKEQTVYAVDSDYMPAFAQKVRGYENEAYLPYGIDHKDGYVAITYREPQQKNIETNFLKKILKEKAVFGNNAFAGFVNVYKYAPCAAGNPICDVLSEKATFNKNYEQVIVDAKLADVDGDGNVDLVYTDLLLGSVGIYNTYRVYLCPKLNSANCEEINISSQTAGQDQGANKLEDLNSYLENDEKTMYLGPSKLAVDKGVISAIFGGRPPMLPSGGCPEQGSFTKDSPLYSPLSELETLLNTTAFKSEQAFLYEIVHNNGNFFDELKLKQFDIMRLLHNVFHSYPVFPLFERSMCEDIGVCKVMIHDDFYGLPLWHDKYLFGSSGGSSLIPVKEVVGDTVLKKYYSVSDFEMCCSQEKTVQVIDGYNEDGTAITRLVTLDPINHCEINDRFATHELMKRNKKAPTELCSYVNNKGKPIISESELCEPKSCSDILYKNPISFKYTYPVEIRNQCVGGPCFKLICMTKNSEGFYQYNPAPQVKEFCDRLVEESKRCPTVVFDGDNLEFNPDLRDLIIDDLPTERLDFDTGIVERSVRPDSFQTNDGSQPQRELLDNDIDYRAPIEDNIPRGTFGPTTPTPRLPAPQQPIPTNPLPTQPIPTRPTLPRPSLPPTSMLDKSVDVVFEKDLDGNVIFLAQNDIVTSGLATDAIRDYRVTDFSVVNNRELFENVLPYIDTSTGGLTSMSNILSGAINLKLLELQGREINVLNPFIEAPDPESGTTLRMLSTPPESPVSSEFIDKLIWSSRLPPGIPMKGNFQIGTVILKTKVQACVSHPLCTESCGSSGGYLKEGDDGQCYTNDTCTVECVQPDCQRNEACDRGACGGLAGYYNKKDGRCYLDESCSNVCVEPDCQLAPTCDSQCGGAGLGYAKKGDGQCYSDDSCSTECKVEKVDECVEDRYCALTCKAEVAYSINGVGDCYPNSDCTGECVITDPCQSHSKCSDLCGGTGYSNDDGRTCYTSSTCSNICEAKPIVEKSVGRKECRATGFSSPYMKALAESLQKDAKEALGVVTGVGELGYSSVKCRVEVLNATDEYVVAYTKGPMPINFAKEARYPSTIKMLNKAVTIAPLDASYSVKSTIGNNNRPATLDISQSSLVSLPASISSLSDIGLSISRMSDNVGIVINNHIGHTIVKSMGTSKSSTASPSLIHEISVNVTNPCASWTAGGGGGEACPAPDMNVPLLKADGKWDDRYVYVFKVVNGTKGGIEEDEIRILGVDSSMFGKGAGGCVCNVSATPANIYEIFFGLFVVLLAGGGFVLARERAKRRK